MDENAARLVRQVAVGFGEPSLKQGDIRLVAAGEISGDEIILALEMIIERPLGDPGFRRHGVDADAPDALAVEQPRGGGDDPFACRHFQDVAFKICLLMYTDQ